MCWKAAPKHSVLSLTHAAAKAFDWYHDGITHLRDLLRDTLFTPAPSIQIRAVHSKQRR
jgi:hypothetical protein